MNQPLQSAYKTVELNCGGSTDHVKTIANALSSGARVNGWAWNSQSRRIVSGIIFTVNDKIVGYAEVGYPRLDLPPHLYSRKALDAGWVGFIEPLQTPFSVKTYGVVNSSRKEICLVQNANFNVTANTPVAADSDPTAIRTR